MKMKSLALTALVWASALQAEPKVLLANEGLSLSVTKSGCGAVGEDLDVDIQSKLLDTQARLKLTLKNYGTVFKNSTKGKTLVFLVNDPSVGTVELSNGKQSVWNVRPSALREGNSQCEIKVTPKAESELLDIALVCANLLPISTNLTLEERVGQRVASVVLTEPLTCSAKF